MTPGDQIISLSSSPLSHLILPGTKRTVLFIKWLRYLCYVNRTTLSISFVTRLWVCHCYCASRLQGVEGRREGCFNNLGAWQGTM